MPTVGRTNFQFRIVKKGNSMKEISQYQGHIHWHAYLFILYSYPPTSDLTDEEVLVEGIRTKHLCHPDF